MKTQSKSPRPRVGEPRKVRQPLIIDRLPMEVHEAIKRLRNQHGLSWEEIERLSALPYDVKWEGKIGSAGFVNWEALPTEVMELFPDLKLAERTLLRWYDIRVEQSEKDIAIEAKHADKITALFVGKDMKGVDQAVLNAARSAIFPMLHGKKIKDRLVSAKYLLVLGDLMQQVRKNEIRERVAQIQERHVTVEEADHEARRKKMDRETENAAKKLTKGGVVTIEDLNRIRERTFGLPPIQHA